MSNKFQNKINDAAFNFYLEADKNSIDEELKSEIHDINEYEKKKKKLIFLAKANANKKRNDYLLTLLNKFQEGIQQNIERPIAILKSLMQNTPSFALYSNLSKLSKEDIIEIIRDKNLIELLEELDQHDKNH